MWAIVQKASPGMYDTMLSGYPQLTFSYHDEQVNQMLQKCMLLPAIAANLLIESLPRKEHDRVLDLCETVDLVYGDILCEYHQPFRHVYFPLSGFISLFTSVGGHPPLEMGLVGNEGMLGTKLVLGVDSSPFLGMVQGAGTALRMTAQQLRRELRHSPALLGTLNRHLYLLITQLSQSVACNRFHEVEPRLARWLLMTHDRAHADEFYLTHQYLADMLGVQRSAVTIAAGALQKQGLIRYTRGEITVLDRKGLEAVSCECYATVNDCSRQLF